MDESYVENTKHFKKYNAGYSGNFYQAVFGRKQRTWQRPLQLKVHIENAPVERAGAVGKLSSVYIRDPGQNIVAISNYIEFQAMLPGL